MSKFNFRKGIAFLLAFFLVLSPLSIQADDGGYSIQDYHVESTYHKNNTITAKETITVDFSSYRHGIYRVIPTSMYVGYTQEENPDNTKQSERYALRIKDIQVDGDNYDVKSENGNKIIQIGDADETIFGIHTYHISYTCVIPEDLRENYDFLYYSILGSSWDTTIDHFSFDVKFEKALTQKEVDNFHVFSGPEGQEDNSLNVQYSLNKSGITGEAYDIDSNEAITLYARLRPNYFVGAYRTPRWPAWMMSIAALVFALLAILRLFHIRNAHVTPVVSFQPPEDMDPAAVGYFVDASSDSVDLMALVPYWAQQGLLRIEQKKEAVTLYKLDDLSESAPSYQKTMWEALFRNSYSCSMKNLGIYFAKRLTRAQDDLKYTFDGNQALDKTDFGLFFVIVAGIFFVLAMLTNSRYTLYGGYLFAIVSLIVLTIILFLRDVGTSRSVFKIQMFQGLRTGIAIVLAVLMIGIVFLAQQTSSGFLPIPWMIAVLVLVLIGLLSANRFHVPTSYFMNQAGQLLGFKEFIEKAEVDQLEKLSQENPEYYYRVIPYAMVFGLSEQWTKKFTNIPVLQPVWISSDVPYTPWLYHTMMYHHISAPASQALTEFNTSKVSSGASSSSFGGFSGGGAIGGGGGSW